MCLHIAYVISCGNCICVLLTYIPTKANIPHEWNVEVKTHGITFFLWMCVHMNITFNIYRISYNEFKWENEMDIEWENSENIHFDLLTNILISF